MREGSLTTSADSKRGAHVVLYRAPDDAPADDLLAALDNQHASVEHATNPYQALAALCAARNSSVPAVLLLASPSRLPGRVRLLAAAERYAPRANCWVFDRNATPTLQPLKQDTPPQPASPATLVPAAKPRPSTSSPDLRLIGEPAEPNQPERIDTSNLLSADELEALLERDRTPARSPK